MVKICHLYENVQNRTQNKKKFDGARKSVSKPYFQAKFKMAAMESIGYHIFINNRDRDKILSPNHMFSVSRNAIKQPLHVFDIIIM